MRQLRMYVLQFNISSLKRLTQSPRLYGKTVRHRKTQAEAGVCHIISIDMMNTFPNKRLNITAKSINNHNYKLTSNIILPLLSATVMAGHDLPELAKCDACEWLVSRTERGMGRAV